MIHISIVQLATEIKNAIMKHFNVSAKIIIHAKKIIARIEAHMFARMASI